MAFIEAKECVETGPADSQFSPPPSELDIWFPQEKYLNNISNLEYRLRQTPEWKEYQAQGEKGGTRLSLSQLETAIPWLLRKLGYNVALPTPPEEKAHIASIIGTALHEANVLFTILSERVRPGEVNISLPSNPSLKNEPYRKMAERFQIGDQATQSEIEEILCSAWEIFHNDPNLVEKVPIEPLIRGMGFKDPGFELEIRQGPLVRSPGLKLARIFAQRFGNGEIKNPDHPTYNEVLIIANLVCGLQLTTRLDGVSSEIDQNGETTLLITDLKTGKKPNHNSNIVPEQIHELQSGAMIIVSERFSKASFITGLLKGIVGGPFILYKINPHSHTGEGSVRFAYKWFNTNTGEINYEEALIAERKALNRRIEWLGKAVNTFKGPLKDYLRTGVEEKREVRKTKKKEGDEPNPFGLVQKEMDFNQKPESKTVYQEFHGIINDLNEATQPDSQEIYHRKVYRLGLVETQNICDDCGGCIVRDCQLVWRRTLTSWISIEERCSSCGKISKPTQKMTVINKNITS